MSANRPLTPNLLPAALIIGIAGVLFQTTPKSEDFWWTDGASFALNGALVHDYLVSGFHRTPMAFAGEWFRHYPAVTISLYPPIFPLAEAFAFTLFGVSHAVAQATVAAFTGLAVFGGYRLARTAMGRAEAGAGVLLLFAAPTILLWSRQVMMELPSLAFLLLAAACFLGFQASRRTRDLVLSVLLLLAAVYTKQTAIFAVPAFAVALIATAGWQGLRDRRVWLAAAAGVIGLLPLAGFTLIAAREALDIALGRGIAAASGGALQGGGHLAQTVAYGLALPEVVGWPLLVAAACYTALVPVRGWRTPAEQRLAVLMFAWFACGFAFVSFTGHFDARYALPLAVPCAMLCALLIARLPGRTIRPFAALTAGAAWFAVSVWAHPIDRISGYDAVAAYILDHSKQDDAIWFQASESKSVSFSLRSRSPEPKVVLLRAEKFLVDYRIARDWGISDRGWTTRQLQDLIDRNDISMAVLEPGFWDDQPSMARMRDYILSDKFRLAAEIPITSDLPSHRTAISIFVRNRPAAARPDR
nr:glycosyltransferase family 39 protein [uncultured Rhodopila sp.]